MPTEPGEVTPDEVTPHEVTPHEVTLRPAEDADVDDLAALHLETRRASEPAMPAGVHDEAEVRSRMAGRVAGSEVWLALADGDPVGYVGFTPTWLEDLYVHPAHQRRGIGTLLLDLVRSRLPEGFSLWVFAGNRPALAFYRAHGLVELELSDGSANEEGAPDVRLAWPGREPLDYLRGQIDEVDDELAVLLARRFALTATVQDHKVRTTGAAGSRGRDAAREAEIVERMCRHAPDLDPARIARVMHALIAESLSAWESRSQ